MRKLGQRGDTIVEVLIAMVIVGLILGGAFVTVNKSLQSERSAQERGEALQLVQGQIESLQALQTSLPTQTVCITVGTTTTITEPAITSLAGTTNYTNYNSACIVNNLGQSSPAAGQEQAFYHLSIIPPSGGSGVYTVRAVWDQLGGGQNNITLFHKPL